MEFHSFFVLLTNEILKKFVYYVALHALLVQRKGQYGKHLSYYLISSSIILRLVFNSFTNRGVLTNNKERFDPSFSEERILVISYVAITLLYNTFSLRVLPQQHVLVFLCVCILYEAFSPTLKFEDWIGQRIIVAICVMDFLKVTYKGLLYYKQMGREEKEEDIFNSPKVREGLCYLEWGVYLAISCKDVTENKRINWYTLLFVTLIPFLFETREELKNNLAKGHVYDKMNANSYKELTNALSNNQGLLKQE